jgi:PKD repeat protein
MDATGSFDPEGAPLTYSWDFGDGLTGAGGTVSHTYVNTGTYHVSILVSDGLLWDEDATNVLITDEFLGYAFVTRGEDELLLNSDNPWFCFGVEPLNANFRTEDVQPSFELSYWGGTIASSAAETFAGEDLNHNGIPEVTTCFSRESLRGLFARLSPGTHEVPVALAGWHVSGNHIYAYMTLTVVKSQRAPSANAGGPYEGVAGFPVQFDGSGSSDLDGDALTYSWDFGDGLAGMGATVMHTYAATGAYNVSLRVTDPGGLFDNDATTATISDFVDAHVFYAYGLDIVIPQILGTWIHLEPVDGSFNIHDVVVSSLTLTYNGETIPSLCKSAIKGDTNKNGLAEIRACFRNSEVEPLFESLPNGITTVSLTLEGDLLSGGKVGGTTTARVIKFSWLHAGSMATVAPNPLNPQGKLSFVVTKPGVTTIQVFDLNGRLVRTLMQREYLAPGLHDVTIDGRNEQGNKLASGVYYYRVQSADGISKGSIAVLR